MPIILCQVFPSSETKKRPADKIKKINQLYAAAVKGDAQITFVETWPLFANAQGDAQPEEFPDLLHPNKAGYAKWAAGLRPILATSGFLETESDLRVEDNPDPLVELRRIVSLWRAYRIENQGDDAVTENRPEDALRHYAEAERLVPGNDWS